VTRRIGLLGGTFDPVHNAHVALACTALDALALDELRWVPSGEPWQKTRRITPSAHRIAMLKLAILGEPRFLLERCEVDRKGPSYTIDTVRDLAEREPGAHWFLVIGQDQFANLHTWHEWQALLARVTLAVAARPGATLPANAEVHAQAYQVLPLPSMAISATAIRDSVARGESVDDLVPPAVARYIGQHGLYLPEGTTPGS
jgi:nicotinate-nucleotide adenylyltransferase